MVRRGAWVVGWLVVGGVLAALVVGVAAAPRDVETSSGTTPAAVRREFLERWEAWRRAPFRFEETTLRRSGSQRRREVVTVAQRGGERIVRDGEAVSAQVGGRRVGCSPPLVGQPVTCIDNGPHDADGEVVTELDRFAEQTTGDTPAYRLSDLGGGCYRLRHLVAEFRPAYGDRTDYCFDRRTGLLRQEFMVADDLTIRTTRADVSTPTDQDFEFPAVPVPGPGVGVGPGSNDGSG